MAVIEKKKNKKKTKQKNGTESSDSSKQSAVSASSSLPSRLKRQRGTAESTPLPPEWNSPSVGKRAFLQPSDGEVFEDCRTTSYQGFQWEDPDELPKELHTDFSTTFQNLEGLYLYDAIQPGGARISHTFCQRTLIGQPGSTYRYLGLRLFSHPMYGVNQDGDRDESKAGGVRLKTMGYSARHAEALLQMGRLNTRLAHRTESVLDRDIKPHVPNGLVGSAKFSLTLVNRMEPTTQKKDLKRDSVLGKTSVSWHKDSGLTDFSSIAVYHTLVGKAAEGKPWRVAVRVASKDSRTPTLSVPLPSGALYYLLDDFNHQHEHAVVTGTNQLRYSSTHRVAREGRGTWQYIRDKCRAVGHGTTARDLRAQQQLLTELEFEWLRQWYVQGKQHADLHPFWHEPIRTMERCYQDLQTTMMAAVSELEFKPTNASVEEKFDVLIEALQKRSVLRQIWIERLRDPFYAGLPKESQPLPVPSWLTEINTTKLISKLRKLKKKMCGRAETKKEKRKIASNWESMRSSVSSQKKARRVK